MAIKKNPQKKIALALQGGGAFGAFTWGVLEAILKDGRFSIEGISGTSAGAMNALALASGFAKHQEEGAIQALNNLWSKLAHLDWLSQQLWQTTLPTMNEGVFNKIQNWLHTFFISILSNVSPYFANPLNYNFVRNFAEECFDIPAIQKTPLPKLFLAATHIKSGKIKIFQNAEVSIDSILAMTCLPTLFHAASINGEFYWDGGLVANPAIFPLIYGCENTKDIVIIPLTKMHDVSIPKQIHEIKARYNEIVLNSCLVREMRVIHFITKLIDEGKLIDPNIHRYNLHVIKNEDLFSELSYPDSFNINPDFLEMLHEKGLEAGEKWIKENFDLLGTDIPFSESIYQDYISLG